MNIGTRVRYYESLMTLNALYNDFISSDGHKEEYFNLNVRPNLLTLTNSLAGDYLISRNVVSIFMSPDHASMIDERIQRARHGLHAALGTATLAEKLKIHSEGFMYGDEHLTVPATRAICAGNLADQMICYLTYAQEPHLSLGTFRIDDQLIASLLSSIRARADKGYEFTVYSEGATFENQVLKDIAIASIKERDFRRDEALRNYSRFAGYRKSDPELTAVLMDAVTRIDQRDSPEEMNPHKARLERISYAYKHTEDEALLHHCTDRWIKEISNRRERIEAYATALFFLDMDFVGKIKSIQDAL